VVHINGRTTDGAATHSFDLVEEAVRPAENPCSFRQETGRAPQTCLLKPRAGEYPLAAILTKPMPNFTPKGLPA
jgi:hypothetical protein